MTLQSAAAVIRDSFNKLATEGCEIKDEAGVTVSHLTSNLFYIE